MLKKKQDKPNIEDLFIDQKFLSQDENVSQDKKDYLL